MLQTNLSSPFDPVLERARAQRVIPVAVIDDPATAAPLGHALAAAGARVVEVTLRTEAAERSIAVLAERGDLLVGAGTVVRPEQVDAAKRAGAQFVVSPGLDARVVKRCRDLGVPAVPGVATASEVMAALALDFSLLKLFPAEACGGIALVRALSGPFPGVRFIPTGGISAANAGEYLRLGSVAAIGGSWMVAPALLAAGDYDAIARLTAEALELAAAA